MNEARFIELLNLYIDQELSADEVGELEREIARNPARRRTYDQYCRMHRGCALLFENARSQAPRFAKLDRAAQEVDEKVLAFPHSADANVVRGPWGRVAWAGGVAAALAVAALQGPTILTALRGPTESVPVSGATAVAKGAPATTPSAPVAARQSDYQLVGMVNRRPDTSRLTFQPVVTPEADWTHRFELTPLQRVSVESLRFASESADAENRTFGGSQPFTPAQSAVEFSAFQFQK